MIHGDETPRESVDPGSERLWRARLRWRMRGAWLWPLFVAFTVLDGVLMVLLPPYEGGPRGIVGGMLLAGFANLALVAIVAPPAGRAVRRRRPDLPRIVANDYAGVGLVLALSAVVLAAGLAHRPAVAAEKDARAAVQAAVADYVLVRAPRFHAGLGQVDALRLAKESYRACVPGPDPRRWLCLIVDTDQRPPRLVRDDSMEPNSALRTVGGFH